MNLFELTRRYEVHHYDTRRETNLEPPFCSLSKQKDCYPIFGIKLFSQLDDTKKLSMKEFKKQLEHKTQG